MATNNNNKPQQSQNKCFSTISINMHGYNQASVFVKEICEKKYHDVIFLQERWLSTDLINNF